MLLFYLNYEAKKYLLHLGRFKTPDIGRLKVSFFGPFYGAYTIIDLDKPTYSYALVTGGKNYLWILSRTPQLANETKQKLIAQAKALGFETDKLIYPNQ